MYNFYSSILVINIFLEQNLCEVMGGAGGRGKRINISESIGIYIQ
jgi:hypothetical protein